MVWGSIGWSVVSFSLAVGVDEWGSGRAKVVFFMVFACCWWEVLFLYWREWKYCFSEDMGKMRVIYISIEYAIFKNMNTFK